MGIGYGWFRVNGYEDINDNVNSQNGAWMTSWLSDHTEKLRLSIPDIDKHTVKIWKSIVDRNFWDNRCDKMCSYRSKVKYNHLTRGNLSCWQIKVICFHRMNRTFDRVPDIRLKIGDQALPIAHSLSYDILNLGRKWSHNNRDTAQRSLPCRFMFGKKWSPIDITRKYEKLCIVAFNRKFDYDDVIKMKN